METPDGASFPSAAPPPSPRPAGFPLKTFLLLAVLNLLGAAALTPFSLSLLRQVKGPLGMPSMSGGLFTVFQTLTGLFVYVPVLALGLVLARTLGLGAPLLDAFFRGEPLGTRWRPMLVRAAAVGLVGGAIVLALLGWVFDPLTRAELARAGVKPPDIQHPAAWQGLLASFGAGVNEETLMRLFALTLVAWLLTLAAGRLAGRPRGWVLWTANGLSALAFGALHLPQAAMMMPLGPWAVGQVLVGNGLLGLAFGWLFWRYGLESAMAAHFSADLILHVIGPQLPFVS